jgi:FKBP-type peptidyl-prolyl cis-trans isomerase 2
LIDNADKGDIIELPAQTIRVHSLYISKPITLIGKPGTVIEVCGGSIFVDFNSSTRMSQNNLSHSIN